jgi:hypothetical protein
MTVGTPLSSTAAPVSPASRLGRSNRPVSTASTSSSTSRPNSAGCGVSSAGRPSSTVRRADTSPANALSASASRTTGPFHAASSRVTSSRASPPSPGPISIASAQAAIAASSAPSRGQVAASAAGSDSWIAGSDSGATMQRTSPAPLRSAARVASTTAPAIPRAPPTMAIFFRVPLCASAGMRGSDAANHDDDASGMRSAASCAWAPSPMSTTTIVPHASRATRWPRLIVPKVIVSALCRPPTFRPVLALSPVGTSSATSVAPRLRRWCKRSTASAMSPRSELSDERPVPSTASTTTDSPPETRSSM